MRSDGDEAVADLLHDVLLALMPAVNFVSLVSKPCVTTCTDDGELQPRRARRPRRASLP